jgi:hypothetical protein
MMERLELELMLEYFVLAAAPDPRSSKAFRSYPSSCMGITFAGFVLFTVFFKQIFCRPALSCISSTELEFCSSIDGFFVPSQIENSLNEHLYREQTNNMERNKIASIEGKT